MIATPPKLRLHLIAVAAGVLLSICAATSVVYAQTKPAAPGAELHKKPAKQGWFWYKDPPEEEKKEPQPVPQVVAPVVVDAPKGPVVVIGSPQKEEVKHPADTLTPEQFILLAEDERAKRCAEKGTWQKECGFIDPGNDFEFQAKQRDELLKHMSISPDKPEAVEAAQRYMKWVVGKASQAANMWYFNMIQNPDLDPTVKNPISEVGLALASRVKDASQYEYFKLIQDEGGKLFFITRNDCSFCHDQLPYMHRVAEKMGLQVINIPLDGICLPGFEGDDCGDNITPEQVAVLDVKVVPAIYLYVPSNTWIRLGTGVVTDQTVLANTVNFFSAYRAAMIAGLENGAGTRPSVTFDPEKRAHPTGAVNADGTAGTGITQERIIQLMGYDEKK